MRDDGRSLVIDVGRSPAVDYSKAAVLLTDREGDEDVVTSLAAAGTRTPLWRGPARP